MPDEYLPPVVAVLAGDMAPYDAMLTEAEARTEAFVAATTVQFAELDARMAALGGGGAGEAAASAAADAGLAAEAAAGSTATGGAAAAVAAEEEAAAARIAAAETTIGTSAEEAATKQVDANRRIVTSTVDMTAAVEAEVSRLARTPITIADAADTAATEYAAAMDKMRADTAKVMASFDAAEAKAAESTAAMGTKMDAAAAESTATMQGKVNAVGSTIGTFAATAGIAVAGEALKMAGDFEQATNRLMTAAGESQQNIGMVRDGILNMTSTVGFTAQQLAQAMYTVDSASFHGADSLTILKAASQGAKIEQADLGTTVDAVTTSLVDYHLGADQAATVMSKLVTAVGEGKTNLQDLAGSLHSVTPLAANLGISLNEVTAAVATMTVHGMSADQATQNLADTIRHLSNPTQTMISEMGQLGLSSQTLSKQLSDPSVGLHGVLEQIYTTIMRNMGPAGDVLLNSFKQSASAGQDLNTMLSSMPTQLKKVAEGLSNGSIDTAAYNKEIKAMPDNLYSLGKQFETLHEKSTGFNDALKSGSPDVQTFEAALAKVMGDSTGLNTALMLGGENAGTFSHNIDAVSKSSSDASGNVKNWSEVQNSLNQKMSDFKGAISSLAVRGGDVLLPFATDFIGDLSKMTDSTKNGKSALDDLAGSLKDVEGGLNTAQTAFANSGTAVHNWLQQLTPGGASGIAPDILAWVNQWVTGGQEATDALHRQLVAASSDANKAGIAVGAGFANGVQGTTPQVVDAAGNLVNSLSGPLGLLTGPMFADGKAVGEHFSDGVDSSLPDVSAASGNLVDSAEAEMNRLQSKADMAGDKSGNQFANGIVNTLPMVTGSSSRLVTGADGTLGRLPGTAFATGMASGTQFATGIGTPLSSVEANAGRLAGAVSGPLTGLPGTAWSSGNSIGNSLARGINSAAGAVADAATNMATIVRNHMPSSPAKVGPLSGSGSPDVLGRNISTMIATGVLSGRDTVAQAMNTVLGAPSAAGGIYGVRSVPSVAGAAGSGGLTINVTVQGSLIYQQELRSFVQDLVLQHDGRNSSNGLSGVLF